MSEEIKVDSIALQAEVGKLNQAIEDFRPFTETFIYETIPKFDRMDAKFPNQMRRTVNNLANDISVTLLAELENFSKDVQAMADIFTATDEELDGMIGASE